jgi:hypothetical protein
MKNSLWLGLALTSLVILPAAAVQLGDGSIAFVQPPRLVDAVTTFDASRFPRPTHYFTLDVPAKAGEPLQQVVIQQVEGFDRDLRYLTNKTVAFEGTYHRKGESLGLKSVVQDRKAQTVTVIFDPPVQPGRTITIGLKPLENPQYGGVYLFGVTAFPRGEKVRSQFLGYGRIHIYDGGDGGSSLRLF